MSKYHNSHVVEDGITFDSKAEARRYQELRLMLAAGLITALEVHPYYPLVVNGVKVGGYEADFRYVTTEGRAVIEDVKGVRTDTYRIKKSLVEALYGIKVFEIQA
jgi:hypothetical protein